MSMALLPSGDGIRSGRQSSKGRLLHATENVTPFFAHIGLFGVGFARDTTSNKANTAEKKTSATALRNMIHIGVYLTQPLLNAAQSENRAILYPKISFTL